MSPLWAGLDFTMMYVKHYSLIHDKLGHLGLALQPALDVKRRLTFDMETGYQSPPENDGNNTEDEIDSFSKLLLNCSNEI